MKGGRVLAVAVVWSASLVGVGLWAQGRGGEPSVQPSPNILPGQPIGGIMTGENIGFQPLAARPDRDGRITGNLMVRVNGEWFETTSPVRIMRSK
jgi:hypothetical protein